MITTYGERKETRIGQSILVLIITAMAVLTGGAREHFLLELWKQDCWINLKVMAGNRCGRDLVVGSESRGRITSPGWPINYLANISCEWTIRAPINNYILVRVHKLFLRQIGAFLKVGSYSVHYSFSNGPLDLYTHRNEVRILLKTGSNAGARGFNATFFVLPAVCPNVSINQDGGTFHTPNWPYRYSVNTQCTWNIQVSNDSRIKLELLDFDVLSADFPSCSNDYVLLYNGWSDNSTLIEKLCSKLQQPYVVYSTGSTMRVKFHSDKSYTRSGFMAIYTGVPKRTEGMSVSQMVTPSPSLAVGSTHETELLTTLTGHGTATQVAQSSQLVPSTTFAVAASKTSIISPTDPPPPQIPDHLGGMYRINRHIALTTNIMKTLRTPDDMACILTCQRTPACKSVTFYTMHQSSRGLCRLHDATTKERPGKEVLNPIAVSYDVLLL